MECPVPPYSGATCGAKTPASRAAAAFFWRAESFFWASLRVENSSRTISSAGRAGISTAVAGPETVTVPVAATLIAGLAVNVAIGLVYYAKWLRELFRPAVSVGASTYDVPNGVGVAIGMPSFSSRATKL